MLLYITIYFIPWSRSRSSSWLITRFSCCSCRCKSSWGGCGGVTISDGSWVPHGLAGWTKRSEITWRNKKEKQLQRLLVKSFFILRCVRKMLKDIYRDVLRWMKALEMCIAYRLTQNLRHCCGSNRRCSSIGATKPRTWGREGAMLVEPNAAKHAERSDSWLAHLALVSFVIELTACKLYLSNGYKKRAAFR